MFILMDKPRASSWFQFGTIQEIQPPSGSGLAAPPPPPPPHPQVLNPSACPSCISTGHSYMHLHFLGKLLSHLFTPLLSSPRWSNRLLPSSPYASPSMTGADKVINDWGKCYVFYCFRLTGQKKLGNP